MNIGTHNLIALCLKARRPEPATFSFCSSVSAVARTKGGFIPEALPDSLEYAQNMGYAQSKLVTEHICMAVAKSYGIKTRVLRVGQVIADSVHGIWNATEAIPLMMQAGLTIGAIPKLDENPLWLPVDVVASTIVDISLSSNAAGVMNVVNHRTFHWTRDLLPALHQAGLKFTEPEPSKWVKALRKSDPNPVPNPPIKLLEFFTSKYENVLPRTGLTYDTSFARFLSPSLAAAPVLDQEMVSKFVKRFQETSWTTTISSIPAPRLIVVAGPCGAGKSSIAKAVSQTYSIPWVEGDNLHSRESVNKMATGVALSDDDRWLWLETIKATALVELSRTKTSDIVITCSALKRSYRDELRRSRVLRTVFLMLQGSPEVLRTRVSGREGHYMGVEMVESQLDSLEAPAVSETDVIPIDVNGSKEEVFAEVLDLLKVT
jgi:carbohydrate kinase (thermoresistant glucokinase family)